jgi:anti-sigma-K factor RskA
MSEEELDARAAEWVLGTLDPAERRAFERLIGQDRAVRDRVRWWQDRLAPLATLVPESEPPPAVWQRIDQTLDRISAGPSRARAPWRGLWQSLALWRGLSLAGGLAAAALAAVLLTRAPPPGSERVLLAVLAGADGEAGWLVEADAAAGALRVQPVAVTGEPERVPELWVLPADGSAPVSLGLLATTAAQTRPLDERTLRALEGGAALAVSLEPPGGSPTGAPTGPVVQTGTLIRKAP